MAKFEGQERRMPKIEACLAEYGWKTLEDADALCKEHGINVEEIVKGVQPIAFENACWAYTLGTAIALKKGCKVAADASEAIGLGLQAFCIPGSVAEQRAVGLGHGNLGAMSPSPLRKARSVSPEPPTKPERNPCGLSSTAWEKTRRISSPESTALPM